MQPARPVLTWRGRRGRMSTAKWEALEGQLPEYTLAGSGWPQLGRPTVLEIGFGMGDATVAAVTAAPEVDVIACEPHLAGVANLCRMLRAEGLTNVRIHAGDALDLLDGGAGRGPLGAYSTVAPHRSHFVPAPSATPAERLRRSGPDLTVAVQPLPDASLAGIRVFFPDPWPRLRHRIKRLVRPPFVALVERVLKADGIVHLSTDIEDYAVQMQEVFAGWTEVAPPVRPVTKFELIGRAAGRPIVDLAFRRC